MQVIHGNRLEILADRLAGVLAQVPLDPMTDEIIVVQNAGMQRWVSLALAARNRVLAKCAFPFPVAFFDALARDLLADAESPDLSNLDSLAFRIMGALPELREMPEAAAIRHYLGPTPDDLKLFQLSRRIAHTFDQYAVYRPEMVRSWDQGRAGHWQALLWRLLFPDGNHRADRLGRLLACLQSTAPLRSTRLSRVSVFGIANLPPVFVDLFGALSRHVPVTVYFLNPCREYWADLLSDREQRRLRQWTDSSTVADLYLAPADRILAAFGSAGRDFFDRLVGSDADFLDAFDPPGQRTLLARVQQGMLDLSARRSADNNAERAPAAVRTDESIQIHACHTPLRCVEVLRDRLLGMFDADATLAPHDILVMTPDIETYAPLIKAVFDASGPPRIPVSVSDRSLLADSGPTRALLGVLGAATGRLTATDVMGLLEAPEIRRRFGISASDLSVCEAWVRSSGIRWGKDDKWRALRGAAPVSDTTWQAGVDRLMAGFAIGDVVAPMATDAVPVSGIGDDQTELLGAFLSFLDTILALPDRLAAPRSPAEWSRELMTLMDQCIDPGPTDENANRQLGAILAGLDLDLGDAAMEVNVEVILDWLGQRCRSESLTGGFGTGGVTCCAMVPMRAVPARVICVLGLDATAFPRQDRDGGFDFMARYPRVGDRSQRLDDLYLILETLLSARQMLYLSYVYKNLQDNTEKPPSVVVGQLLDALETQYGVPSESIMMRHYLHASAPAYFFPDSRFPSYAGDQCFPVPPMADRELAGPVISSPLPPPDDGWRHVDLDDLCLFFRNPCRYLLNRRLGMVLTEPAEPLEDEAPTELDGLARFRIGEDLLTADGTDSALAWLRRVHQADGTLPAGSGGDVLFDQLRVEAARLLPLATAGTAGRAGDFREFAVACGPFRLTGWLSEPAGLEQVMVRFGTIRGTDWITAWIRHLALCLTQPSEPAPVTTLVGFGPGTFKSRHPVRASLKAPVEAASLMTAVLETYWQGLCEPLPFFPETSYTYINSLSGGGPADFDKAWADAEKTWFGHRHSGGGESEDPYVRLCFRNRRIDEIPLAPAAEAVIGPILSHRVT